MTEEQKPPYSLDFNNGEPPIPFESLDALISWVKVQRDFWGWIPELHPQQGPPKQLWDQATNIWHQIQSAATKLKKTNLAPNERDQSQNELETAFGRLKKNGIRIANSDSRAQHVEKLRESDLLFAAQVMVAFSNPDLLNLKDANNLRALIQATLFSTGLAANTAAAEKEALAEERTEWKAFVGRATGVFAKHRESFATLEKGVSDLRETQGTEFKTLMEESEKKLHATEKTYDEKLALQAPVKYWKDKRRAHYITAVVFGSSFVVSLFVAAWLLWLALHGWLIPILQSATDTKTPFWAVGFLIAGASFLIWPVRILSRLLLSNLHLAADAEQRATMANTYLSLLRSDDGLPPDDRKLILERLFGSVSTGIVRDDASPNLWPDILSRIASGK